MRALFMPARKKSTKTRETTAQLGFEATLWLAADKLRSNMDAAEYKHVVLGELIDLIGTIGLGDPESRSKDIKANLKGLGYGI
jgi:hypothetical protein